MVHFHSLPFASNSSIPSFNDHSSPPISVKSCGFYFKILTKRVMTSSKSEDSEFILESCYAPLPMPKLSTNSICELLLEKAKEHVAKGRTKWVTDTATGETLVFADVEPFSRKVASAMTRRGMIKGDVALYLTLDVTKIFTTILGVWRLGGIMYSSYPEDTPDTLLTRIQQSRAKWVFCDPATIPQVKKAISDPSIDWPIEIILFGPDVPQDGCTNVSELYKDDGAACPAKIDSDLDDPLLILCTSGTTGKSKGAVYTNQCLLYFCLGLGGIPRNEKPAMLLIRSTHVLGCLFPLRNIHVGVYSIMMSEVTKLNIFKAVHEYQPILAFGFPTYLKLLTTPEAEAYDRSSLEVICTGGIVLTPQYYETMMTLPSMKYVINGYGMTECGALTTTVDLSVESSEGIKAVSNMPHLSVGRLYAKTSLKVVNLDSGKTLGPNQQGELYVRSPVAAVGYWNQPEETKSTFLEDGWLRTGDMGYYDENGFIFIVDRIKETFKYFNNHISPAELEEFLLRHPAVAEACCFGVPDSEGGDIPRAVVVLRPDAAKVTGKEIQEFVDAQVASYKKLRGGVFIAPSLPRGNTGKVVRAMVAKMDLSAE